LHPRNQLITTNAGRLVTRDYRRAILSEPIRLTTLQLRGHKSSRKARRTMCLWPVLQVGVGHLMRRPDRDSQRHT
jgi:hypothetical protein